MQMEAIALDARGHELTTITSFNWASSSAAVPLFNTTGLITALFTLNGPQTAVITATATLDGVTASGFTPVTEAVPQGFDFAALMLTEYELPTQSWTLGEGIAYFSADGAGIAYRIIWNRLSGPAVEAHIHGPGTAADVADSSSTLHPAHRRRTTASSSARSRRRTFMRDRVNRRSPSTRSAP